MNPETPSAAAAATGGEPIAFWIGFGIFVVVMLLLDLLVFHKKPHEVKTKEAIGWSIFWIALALIFNAMIPWIVPHDGGTKAKEFFSAYVLEKALSIDNLFVIVLIFQYFKVPGEHQHRVLFLGILGAILMRLIFILAGTALLDSFHWMIWVMGAVLILTAAKLMFSGDEQDKDPSKSLIVRMVRKFVPYVDEYHGSALTIVQAGKRYATPLLIVLIVIELTDVVFAVDSVPACLAISDDPFIIFTSNIFAILGLRALYFLLARFLGSFHYLKYGLAVVLGFVGVKMILSHPSIDIKVDTNLSLIVIFGVLAIATVASLLHKPTAKDPAPPAA